MSEITRSKFGSGIRGKTNAPDTNIRLGTVSGGKVMTEFAQNLLPVKAAAELEMIGPRASRDDPTRKASTPRRTDTACPSSPALRSASPVLLGYCQTKHLSDAVTERRQVAVRADLEVR